MKTQVRQLLLELEQAMKQHQLWEATPPSDDALSNPDPFCVNTLTPSQWLQWVFVPKMHALLDAEAALPRNFAITPYLEEAISDEAHLEALHAPLIKLERLLTEDAC